MSCRRGPVLAAGIAVAVSLVATSLGGQQPGDRGPQPPATLACIQRIPASAMRPTTVYVAASMQDSTLQDALVSADALARVTADEVQAMLGATAGQLPRGEPALTWHGLHSDLLLTAHRDGRLTWRPDSVGSMALADDSTAQAGALLLGRGLERVRANGRGYFWPPTVAADSVTFRFVLHSATVDRKGRGARMQVRGATPLLSVDAPWEEPVRVVRPPRIAYPDRARSANVIGIATMQYVIDTAGRVEPHTVRDMLASRATHLDAQMRAHYDAFVASVRRGISTAQYSPAIVGGCPVRQLVQQPFQFQFGR